MDEAGIDHHLHRPFARSAKGVPVPGWIPGRRFSRTGIVAGLRGKRIISPLQYDGTMDAELFEFWFERHLLRGLKKRSVMVLDNARIHRKSVLQALARRRGCEVLFLPAYSPDLNPIENVWAWLKNKLKDILPKSDSLDSAILDCFKVH